MDKVAAVLEPGGKWVGPEGRSELEGLREEAWALPAEGSQAGGAAVDGRH